MRIAIDLDGVVFNSEMFFMASGEIYDAMILGKNSIIKADEPRVQNKYSWNDKELQGYIDRYANSLDFDIMPCAKIVIDALNENNETYVISGKVIEKVMRNINFDDYESVQYFQRFLDMKGINKALEKRGIQEGDTVRIGDVEFEYIR